MRKQVWYWFQWVLYKQDSTKQRSLKDNSGLNIAFFGTFWHFIRNTVNCSWTNLKFVSQTILNVWKILLGTFWVFSTEHSEMFSKQFSNVKEHFLECFANILKSAKLFSEHVGIIQSTVICSIQNLTLFYRTILNVWQLFFELFGCFIRNTLKCFPNNSWMFRNIFWNVLLTF